MAKTKTKYRDKDPFEKWIIRKRNRITRRNRNWNCVVLGETGSGKSYTGARICELIDPTFMPTIMKRGIKSRVAMGETRDFLRVLDKKKLKRGNMIMFDEAGVAISSRDWYKEMNKMVMNILQTFRHMNIGVIFTVPDISFVDKQSRALFHTSLEAIKIDYKANKVLIKVLELQTNARTGKTYFKYPRFHRKRVEGFRVRKPSKEFISRYEPLKEELSVKLRERAIIETERIERKEKIRRTDKEMMREIKRRNLPLDPYRLQFELGVGKDRSYRLIKNYEKFSPFL